MISNWTNHTKTQSNRAYYQARHEFIHGYVKAIRTTPPDPYYAQALSKLKADRFSVKARAIITKDVQAFFDLTQDDLSMDQQLHNFDQHHAGVLFWCFRNNMTPISPYDEPVYRALYRQAKLFPSLEVYAERGYIHFH